MPSTVVLMFLNLDLVWTWGDPRRPVRTALARRLLLHPIIEIVHESFSHGSVSRFVAFNEFPIQVGKLAHNFSDSSEVGLLFRERWPEPMRIVLDGSVRSAAEEAISELSVAGFSAKLKSAMGV